MSKKEALRKRAKAAQALNRANEQRVKALAEFKEALREYARAW